MLHVRMLSGSEVASVPLGELSNVRSLKQQLTHLHGLPPRFRQRLLCRGENLDDTAELDCPMNLDLVLLPFADVSDEQVNELLTNVREDSIEEAAGSGTLNPKPPTFKSTSTEPYKPNYAPALNP